MDGKLTKKFSMAVIGLGIFYMLCGAIAHDLDAQFTMTGSDIHLDGTVLAPFNVEPPVGP